MEALAVGTSEAAASTTTAVIDTASAATDFLLVLGLRICTTLSYFLLGEDYRRMYEGQLKSAFMSPSSPLCF